MRHLFQEAPGPLHPARTALPQNPCLPMLCAYLGTSAPRSACSGSPLPFPLCLPRIPTRVLVPTVGTCSCMDTHTHTHTSNCVVMDVLTHLIVVVIL